MIAEDYVSFEIAKLLKEKGFDEACDKKYFGDDCSGPSYIRERWEDGGDVCPMSNSDLDGGSKYADISAPTLQMAMKWLREDKKILISIFCHIDKGYWFCIQHFINSPYKFATSESIHRKEEILGKIQYYDTYEEACEAAIKYCLVNLI